MEGKNSNQCQYNGKPKVAIYLKVKKQKNQKNTTEEKHGMSLYCRCGVLKTLQSNLSPNVSVNTLFLAKIATVTVACKLTCYTCES